MSLRPFVETNATIAHLQRSLTAMSTALDGVDNAIMTASLNAAIEGLEIEWRGWWEDWQFSPPQREASFEVIPPPEDKASSFDKMFSSNAQLAKSSITTHQSKKSKDKRCEEGINKRSADSTIVLPRRVVRHRVIGVITNLTPFFTKTAPDLSLNHQSLLAFSRKDTTGVRIFDTFIYDVALNTGQRKPNH